MGFVGGRARAAAFVITGLVALSIAAGSLFPLVTPVPIGVGYGTGGSMAPTMHDGSVLLFVDSGAYESGDVVMYYNPDAGGYVVHRVVTRTSDGRYITKGDANSYRDQPSWTSPVRRQQIAGEVVASYPLDIEVTP